jgi:hypothetical protein
MPHLVSQIIVRRLKKAAIQDASLHRLRHTLASALLSQRVPLPVVSARLGHADISITARIHSHALPDDDNRAAYAYEEWSDPIKAGSSNWGRSTRTVTTSGRLGVMTVPWIFWGPPLHLARMQIR